MVISLKFSSRAAGHSIHLIYQNRTRANLIWYSTAALELLDIRVNHHDQSMKNEQAFQKKMSRHGKNLAAHNMITGATQENYNGYQQNYNAAGESITF